MVAPETVLAIGLADGFVLRSCTPNSCCCRVHVELRWSVFEISSIAIAVELEGAGGRGEGSVDVCVKAECAIRGFDVMMVRRTGVEVEEGRETNGSLESGSIVKD